MKTLRWVACAGAIFLGLSSAYASTNNVPTELNLIFPDQILRLDFRVQDYLLTVKPEHYITVGNAEVPIQLEHTLLPENNPLIPIQTRFVPQLATEELREFFASSSLLKDPKQNTVEIRFDERNPEKIIFEGAPHAGYEIEFNRLIQVINTALLDQQTYVQVPAHKIYSQVVAHPDLTKQGINEIIAIGESNFTGSSRERRQNILAAVRKFNGQIIPKGKVFSFNETLESVEEKDGFVRELVIKGDKTEKELGGGVCQVSTTAFRAAFNGGLPIRARRNHSYAVPYYKPYGLDAAIYLGALDMRFKNDTPGDILIQAYTEGDDVFFVFYGTDDDREIRLQGPFISEHKKAPDPKVFLTEDLPDGEMEEIAEAHDGFKTKWLRTVTKANQVNKQEFVSVYRPWPAKIRQGTNKISQKRRRTVQGG